MVSPQPSPLSIETLQELLKRRQQADVDVEPLLALRLFQQLYAAHESKATAVEELLTQAIHRLAPTDPDAATLLRGKYLEGQSNQHVTRQLNIAEATFYRRQQQAIARLTETIWAMEAETLHQRQQLLLQRLEAPTATHLFGLEEAIADLTALLSAQFSPHTNAGVYNGTIASTGTTPLLILIEGMGGIGKTALADAVMRQLMAHVPSIDIAWVTARQRFLDMGGHLHTFDTPALTGDALVGELAEQILGETAALVASPEKRLSLLQAHLQKHPHVVVIDNLETVADLEVLLPQLRLLANPTRFLLTSRRSLYTQGDIYHYKLSELRWEHAHALLLHEARQRNLPQLLQAPASELYPIYETVGGNPLALRLVVGQLHAHALDVILDDLRAARDVKSETLYDFIYRRAWEHLDETARNVLIAMPVVMEEGGTPAMIEAISGIESAALRPALEQLIALNLVNSAPHLHQRQYSIHSLTRSFLMQQVLQWQ